MAATVIGSVVRFLGSLLTHVQSNCENIGAIKKEYAKKIIQFHQLVDAVVQDIKPGGIVSNGATIEVFKELDEIFTQALQVGSELAAKKV